MLLSAKVRIFDRMKIKAHEYHSYDVEVLITGIPSYKIVTSSRVIMMHKFDRLIVL